MLCFYAAKGGVGCSVVAAATAVALSRHRPTLLVGLAGDVRDVLGLPLDGERPDGYRHHALAGWFAADAPTPDALGRMEEPIGELSLLACEPEAMAGREHRLALLGSLLGADARAVVVDIGNHRHLRPLLAQASRSVLVTNACFVALSRARHEQPDDVVLITEPHRSLTGRDVASVLKDPVVAIDHDWRIHRVVDAGLLLTRLPRALEELGHVFG